MAKTIKYVTKVVANRNSHLVYIPQSNSRYLDLKAGDNVRVRIEKVEE
jgi:hypothetical protein